MPVFRFRRSTIVFCNLLFSFPASGTLSPAGRQFLVPQFYDPGLHAIWLLIGRRLPFSFPVRIFSLLLMILKQKSSTLRLTTSSVFAKVLFPPPVLLCSLAQCLKSYDYFGCSVASLFLIALFLAVFSPMIPFLPFSSPQILTLRTVRPGLEPISRAPLLLPSTSFISPDSREARPKPVP